MADDEEDKAGNATRAALRLFNEVASFFDILRLFIITNKEILFEEQGEVLNIII